MDPKAGPSPGERSAARGSATDKPRSEVPLTSLQARFDRRG